MRAEHGYFPSKLDDHFNSSIIFGEPFALIQSDVVLLSFVLFLLIQYDDFKYLINFADINQCSISYYLKVRKRKLLTIFKDFINLILN